MTRAGPARTCTSCGLFRPHEAHGWCLVCYRRWVYRGRPASGPPPPARLGGNKPGRIEDRLEEWRFFRGCGWDREKIAARLGLSIRTLLRYERREQGAGSILAA